MLLLMIYYTILRKNGIFFLLNFLKAESKNLPAMWEIRVQSVAWEDPLKKGKSTHSSILAWRIPCTEEPGRLQSLGSQNWT